MEKYWEQESITTPLVVLINQKDRIVYYSLGYRENLLAAIQECLAATDALHRNILLLMS